MKKVSFWVVVLMLALSLPVSANMIDEKANSSDYLVKAPFMLVRAVEQIAISPLEPLVHTYQGTVDGKPVAGTLQGLGDGIIWTLDRVGRSIWDIATSLAPNYNGAPSTHPKHLCKMCKTKEPVAAETASPSATE